MKWIATTLLSVAILAAAGAGVYVMNARDSVARKQLRTAEAREEAAKSAERQALSEEKSAASRENAKNAEAKAAEENRKAKEAELATAKVEEARAAAEKETALANKAAREAEAAAAAANRDAERAKAQTAAAEAAKAKSEAEKAAANAEAENARLERERLKSDAVIAEARLWELKEKDLEALERDLVEYKMELDERERALRPEKTIKDLANIPEAPREDAKEAAPLLPEDNPGLPAGERKLAKADRIRSEKMAELKERTRAVNVARLERLYIDAIKEDRVIDAAYYRATLKSLYPNWEFKGGAK